MALTRIHARRRPSLTCTALLAVAATLSLPTNVHASFYTHIVQIGAGGADTSIDDVSEAAGLLDGGFGSY